MIFLREGRWYLDLKIDFINQTGFRASIGSFKDLYSLDWQVVLEAIAQHIVTRASPDGCQEGIER